MSRTYKDKPSKFHSQYYRNDKDFVCVDGVYLYELKLPTTKPKKRKEVDVEWHWMNTPGWWNHLFHTKPRRVSNRCWIQKIIKSTQLDEEDWVKDTNKPHKYFW